MAFSHSLFGIWTIWTLQPSQVIENEHIICTCVIIILDPIIHSLCTCMLASLTPARPKKKKEEKNRENIAIGKWLWVYWHVGDVWTFAVTVIIESLLQIDSHHVCLHLMFTLCPTLSYNSQYMHRIHSFSFLLQTPKVYNAGHLVNKKFIYIYIYKSHFYMQVYLYFNEENFTSHDSFCNVCSPSHKTIIILLFIFYFIVIIFFVLNNKIISFTNIQSHGNIAATEKRHMILHLLLLHVFCIDSYCFSKQQ